MNWFQRAKIRFVLWMLKFAIGKPPKCGTTDGLAVGDIMEIDFQRAPMLRVLSLIESLRAFDGGELAVTGGILVKEGDDDSMGVPTVGVRLNGEQHVFTVPETKKLISCITTIVDKHGLDDTLDRHVLAKLLPALGEAIEEMNKRFPKSGNETRH